MFKGLRYSFLLPLIFAAGLTHAQLGGQSGGLNKMMQQSQGASEVNKPKEYELAGITVSGAKYLDQIGRAHV